MRMLGISLVVLLGAFGVRAEEQENPYKSAKKGDWVSYKMTTMFGGQAIEISLKQTVADKDDKTVTVKISGSFAGMPIPEQTQKIDLTQPFDPSKAGNPIGGGAAANAKVEKIADGKETLEIAGKKYDCTWIENKVSFDAGGMKIEGKAKTWLCKTIPLSGMVKSEMKSDAANFTMTYESSGNEK